MAIELDRGSDHQIDLASPAALDDTFAGGGTVTFWINIDAITASGTHSIFQKLFPGWELDYMQSYDGVTDCWRLSHGFSTATGNWRTDGSTAVVGQWDHIAMTYDNGNVANNPVFYINGVSVTVSEADTPVGTRDDDSAKTLIIGRTTHGPDAKLEDMRIFKGAVLTTEQIAHLASGYRGPVGGEDGWWDFMTGRNGIMAWAGTTLSTSETLPDLSVNDNSGTPTNNPVARESEAPRYGVLA